MLEAHSIFSQFSWSLQNGPPVPKESDQELIKVPCLIYRSLQLKLFINCNFCVVAKCYNAALQLTIFVLFTKTSKNCESTRKFQLLLKSTAGAKGFDNTNWSHFSAEKTERSLIHY